MAPTPRRPTRSLLTPTRRRVLRLAGAAASGLAGCSMAGDSTSRPTVTPAPVPTRPSTGTRVRPTPGADAIAFEVAVRRSFTELSPGRLAITFENVGETRLTALDGPEYVLPFVDDDYAGTDAAGDPALLLVPDDSTLVVDPEGEPAGHVGTFLPEAPSNGCWTVPFDWPDARGASTRTLRAVTLPPGARRRHEYSLFFIGACAAGTYRFENTFDLAAGDPPSEAGLVRTRLGFEVTVEETMAIRVRVHEPVLAGPTSDA